MTHSKSTAVRLPLDVEDITAAWLTSALQPRFPGVHVTRLTIGNIIWGSATKVWLLPEYNRVGIDAGLPPSMVLKSGFDPRMRELAFAVYEREALFFEGIAPLLSIPLPKCFFAGTDHAAKQSAVLLEDLVARGCTFGRNTDPVPVGEVRTLLGLLADLHARWWAKPDDPAVREFRSNDARFAIVDYLLGPDNWARCVDGPRGSGLPAPIRNREKVAGAIVGLRAFDQQGPRCLIHGDAHRGNLYFEPDGAPRLLDWQACTLGSWVQDVAYLATGALSTPDRRANEQDLLMYYLKRLRSHGLDGVPAFDEAWTAWRRQVAYGFLGLLCTPEMQSEEYATVMGTRFAVAMDDLGTLGLFA